MMHPIGDHASYVQLEMSERLAQAERNRLARQATRARQQRPLRWLRAPVGALLIAVGEALARPALETADAAACRAPCCDGKTRSRQRCRWPSPRPR
jgi:hypothetical protein